MFIYVGLDRIGAKYLFANVRSIPIVGTIANNVRPIDRLAKKCEFCNLHCKTGGYCDSQSSVPSDTLAPILKWANKIGNQWVESTVRSYRKGVK